MRGRARARAADGAPAGGTVAAVRLTGVPARIGLVALALSAVPALSPGVAAQTLADRMERLPDGWVRFTYEAREGVCGSDGHIRIEEDGAVRVTGGGCACACEEGPVRVDIRKEDGRPVDLDVEVAGRPDRRDDLTDLGEVPAGEAVGYLLALARRGPGSVGKRAVFAATLGRGVEPWPALLALARDDDVGREVRKGAVFWLGQAAGRRATEGLESVIRDEDDLEVREAAIFALSQQDEGAGVDALIRVARTHPEPELRKKALFWLGQRAEDPRVLALFEELLTPGG